MTTDSPSVSHPSSPDSPEQPSTADLGPGGPIVSRLALGTMTFGVETPERDAHRQLDTFVASGGTFIDTADVYGSGESERIIGRWAADRGGVDDLIISTKGRFAPPSGSHGASRRSLQRSVDASLLRLGLDAIDVYFVHGWDEHTPVAETLDTLTSLVRAGKLHHIAWSNVTGWQLQQIVTTAALGGYVSPVAVQPQYNLLDRGIELEVMPCALGAGLALTPWSPLGGGWLTGKYQRDQRPVGDTRLGEDPDRGVEAYDVRNTERTWRILAEVTAIARAHDRPAGHVAIAWLLSRPGVASVLLGARTIEQLEDNLAAGDLVLSPAELDRLTSVSSIDLPPYPYAMIEDFCDVDVWKRLGTASA
ncbi:MAG: aldo/keto reductase [Ilumatobacter sp.]|uniref:aldo/keto reductase n=1 Tax=Ilumatobacter sp. TaxID=1967498 RepID=UPI003C72E9DE